MVAKLPEYTNFTVNGTITGFKPFVDSIVTVVPGFFPILLFFLIFIGGTLGVYFSILKTTGNKRFFESLTAMSFISFLIAGIVALNNSAAIEYLSGYWVVFYIVATIISFIVMSNNKP
jgi:hypothetical protein